jgi:hypothetical protein
MTTVYIRLLNEGVDVWRPVEATPDAGAFRLPDLNLQDEEWEFPPGSLVKCKRRVFSGGASGLAAVRALTQK